MYDVGSMLVYLTFKAPSDCESLSRKKRPSEAVWLFKNCNIASHLIPESKQNSIF